MAARTYGRAILFDLGPAASEAYKAMEFHYERVRYQYVSTTDSLQLN